MVFDTRRAFVNLQYNTRFTNTSSIYNTAFTNSYYYNQSMPSSSELGICLYSVQNKKNKDPFLLALDFKGTRSVSSWCV